MEGSRPRTAESLWGEILVASLSLMMAGVLLGMLNAFEYLYDRPWGVTGETYRWAVWLSGQIRLAPPTLLPAGCESCPSGAQHNGEALTAGFMINVGMIWGTLAGALLSGGFKWRRPRHQRSYAYSLGGGILMGYDAGLAQGCTIGAFFSAIPSLSLSGWAFGAGLALGSYLRVNVVRKWG